MTDKMREKLLFERECEEKGYKFIAGVDEVGSVLRGQERRTLHLGLLNLFDLRDGFLLVRLVFACVLGLVSTRCRHQQSGKHQSHTHFSHLSLDLMFVSLLQSH